MPSRHWLHFSLSVAYSFSSRILCYLLEIYSRKIRPGLLILPRTYRAEYYTLEYYLAMKKFIGLLPLSLSDKAVRTKTSSSRFLSISNLESTYYILQQQQSCENLTATLKVCLQNFSELAAIFDNIMYNYTSCLSVSNTE